MNVAVTLVLNNGREIEYDKEVQSNTIDLARDFILLQDIIGNKDEPFLKPDKDIAVRRSDISYFKVAELEEEELEGKAITSI